MSGHVGDLSFKQEELFNEFKSILSDVLEPKHDDHLLLQFLRARCFDLKKSEDMFRKHLQWRKQFSQEFMVTDYKCPEVLRKYLPVPMLGFDKEGSPIRLVQVGRIDLKGVTHACKLRDMEEFAVWCLDTDMKKTKQYNKKLGRYVENRTFIFDLEGLSLRQITIKSVLDLIVAYLKFYEANYPENLKVAVVINIPYFFQWIFNIVKSILSEETIKKIKIFGKDGYEEELLKIVDPAILPVCYGGTRPDDVGDSSQRILFETLTVPSCYYLKNQRKLSIDDDGVREITVGRRSKREIAVYTDSPGSTILWEVHVPDQDLSVGLFYKKEAGDDVYIEEITPFMKAGGAYGPASGTYITKKAGKYVLVLDNGFSLIRGKRVLYKFSVMAPVVDEIMPIPY